MKKLIYTLSLLAFFTSSIIAQQNNSLAIDLNVNRVPESTKSDIKDTIFFTVNYGQTEELTLVISDIKETKMDDTTVYPEYNELIHIRFPEIGATKWEIKKTEMLINLSVINEERNVAAKNEDSEKTSIPISQTKFIQSQLINPNYSKKTNINKSVIKYNVCSNNYEIYNGDGTSNKKRLIYSDLRHKKNTKSNKGVIFLIEDINTLKYEISVDKSENSNNTEMPELFTIVESFITSNKQWDETKYDFQNYICQIGQLNNDLNRYFNNKLNGISCFSMEKFEEEKATILKAISKELSISGFDIESKYKHIKKEAGISDEDIKNYEITLDNKEKITPNKLVENTQQLINKLINTSFQYQYNVPQLKNVDELVFTLNIQPQKGVNGGLHLKDEKIFVPLRGGWKIDFTTGFYYSSISNKKYSLSNYEWEKTDTTILMKEINKDSDGKGTIGVNALMHCYPRLGVINTGPTFGVGMSLDLNYSLLLGWSIIFGQKNRVALSGGFNISSIKELSKNYQEINGKLLLPGTSTEVNRHNTIKRDYFFSLTYSLGLSNKSQDNSLTNQK